MRCRVSPVNIVTSVVGIETVSSGCVQSAVSTVMVSGILLAIGYEVDSVTDTFLGELSSIPTMLTWFIVIMGLVPGILGIVAWLFLKKYPITDEIRADMDQKLNK